ncbi:two-component response regulator-like protein [Rhynchospora pubera]|uniref:Two-component response regulator-like protein n=1 Tax=Rhynchospora pubera TaxID=906938 RepID=A0AAV8CAI5_9POAL|nr:two-component response regulator-like protein [Rhynchospora pubera]
MEQGTRDTGDDATDDGGGGGGGAVRAAGPKRQGIRWDQILPRRSLRVLLVEYDDSTRQVVTALLRKCSYHVVGVADGLKAWEIMQEKRFQFDLVLTEVAMPSLSGIGLLTKVVSTEECKNIPVIMMSSQDSIGVVLKCMLKGAVDFLVKPVRKNELRNLWQHVWRRHCSSSQANVSDNYYNAASNRISANIGDASKTGENSDGANEAQSSGTKEEMEIESAQNFVDIPSAEGTSSSKEMQGRDANSIPVRSDTIANDSNEVDRERAGTTTEANNSDVLPRNKDALHPSEPVNEVNCNISESRKDATQEDPVVNTKSLEGCFKLKSKAVLNHSESSAFSRYGEKKKNLNDYPSSSLHFRNGEYFKDDIKTSSSLLSKEDAINHQSLAPQLGFIPVHFPVGSIPYGYTTILHPIYYPSYPPPDNSVVQITSEESNHSKCNDVAEFVAPDGEKEDSRELCLVNQKGSCNHDVAIASGSGETGNGIGNASGNGNLESGNESAAHTGDRSRREAALIKFRLKRKDRCFEKKVRYHNRKKLAEQRPRVKGQFVSQKASTSAPQTETEG